MQRLFLKRLRGYVRVTVRGKQIEAFVNRAVQQGIALWDMKRTGEGRLSCRLLIRDFFRLRALLKETGCRIHVEERFGLPFLLGRLEKRKFFAIGLVGFIVGLYVLSSVVWRVEVTGNEKLTAHEILSAAQAEGLGKYQWKFRLKDLPELSRSIQSRLPGTAWVGVEMQGTHATVKVVESVRPEAREPRSPRDLIAAKSAVITRVTATRGKVVVQPNQYVRKGDVLISGTLGNENNTQVVPADGKVWGIVWYESTIEVPIAPAHKVYTGEGHSKFYLVFGSRALQITGYGKPSYETSETQASRHTLQLWGYSLPFGWLKEKVREAKIDVTPQEEAAAQAIGMERAKANLLLQAGADSKVVKETILQSRTENGKVYMKALFQVEEPLAMERLLTPEVAE